MITIAGIYLKNGGRFTRNLADFLKSLGNSLKKNEGISMEFFEFLNYSLNIIINPSSQIMIKNQDGNENGVLANISEALKNEIFASIYKYLNYGIKDKSEKKHSHFLSYNLLIIAIQVKN